LLAFCFFLLIDCLEGPTSESGGGGGGGAVPEDVAVAEQLLARALEGDFDCAFAIAAKSCEDTLSIEL
jgi:hypothetical protein